MLQSEGCLDLASADSGWGVGGGLVSTQLNCVCLSQLDNEVIFAEMNFY